MAKLDIGQVFKVVLDTGLEILKETIVKKAAQVPGVQREVQVQAEKKGKDILWTIAPFAAVGLIIFLIIRR